MARKLKTFVYMLSCPGDPTKYLDPFGPDDEPHLYSTKELADLALLDYVKEFPDDDPPPEVLEIEVKQTFP